MKHIIKLLMVLSLWSLVPGPWSLAATPITTRAGKGSSLTWTEMDANTTNLRDSVDNGLAAANAAITALQQGQAGGTWGFTTKSAMDADLAHVANTLARVTNDSTASNNGIYIKLGAAGSGSWQKSTFQDQPFVLGSMYNSLNAAVTAIGSAKTTLLYTSDLTVTGNLSIPATLELMPINGAIIQNGTYTISYLGPTTRWDITPKFNGSGAVTGLIEARPEWFGAIADGTTDCSAAFTKALASLTSATSFGGLLRLATGTYLTNFSVIKSNITIAGNGRSATPTMGGMGGTLLKPYSTASPCITIGNGTDYVEWISFHGLSLYGAAGSAISGNDGIKINGASQIVGYDFNILQFGGDNISVVSSATMPSSGIKLSFFDSAYAWGSCFKAVYGSSYVTDIALSNFHMNGKNYTGAYAIYLTGGVQLRSFAGFIDTGGDRQGHVYLSSLTDTITGDLIIDGSGPSTNTTVECNYGTTSYPSNVLIGNVTFNKSMLWGDASKTSGGEYCPGGFPFNILTQQLRTGKIVLSESPSTLQSVSTDSDIYAYNGNVWIENNNASNNVYIRMGPGGYIQLGGTGPAAGSIILGEISASYAEHNSIYVDSTSHKLSFKDNTGTVHTLY